MARVILILTVFLHCWCNCTAAAEIDSVTPRRIALEESLGELNRIFRKRLADGVARANERAGDVEDLKSDEFCDEELLYTELRKALFNTFTASWGLKGYQLDVELRGLLADRGYSLSLNDSIYRDITYLEGFSLNLKELSDVVNIGGHLVGLDKIGHMFAEGYRYFAMVREDGASLGEAMAWGREQEEGKYGYLTTGIFSYGDLVANFHGYRFWNSILGHGGDPLKSWFADWFSPKYVECRIQIIDSIRYRKIVRAWELETSFDLAEYVDGVWDEGNNCVSYGDPEIEAKVRARVAEIDPQFRCPLLPQQCASARSRYGRYAKLLLHPACLVAEMERP